MLDWLFDKDDVDGIKISFGFTIFSYSLIVIFLLTLIYSYKFGVIYDDFYYFSIICVLTFIPLSTSILLFRVVLEALIKERKAYFERKDEELVRDI